MDNKRSQKDRLLNLKWLLLLLVPLLFFGLSFSVLLNTRTAFMAGGDPMYAYLLNGLTLAEGSTEIGHTDNPGTTVQCFSAIVIRAVYAFSDASSVAEDVIAHPEKYLFIGRITLIILNTLLVLLLGWLAYKYKNRNVWLAVFFQCAALTGILAITHSTSFAPEGLLLAAGLLMNILCLNFIHSETPDNKLLWKHVSLFALLTGFVAVTKFSAVGYFLIPLFTLPSKRNVYIFLILFVACFVFFMLPAIHHFDSFLRFILGIATHEGQYGTGSEQLFSADSFFTQLKAILDSDWLLHLTLIISVSTVVLFIFRLSKLEKLQLKQLRLLCGLTASILFNLFLTARHPGDHYLIPSQLILLLTLYLSVSLLKDLVSFGNIGHWKYKNAMFVLIVFLPFALTYRFKQSYYYNPGFTHPSESVNRVLFGEDHLARIYVNTLSSGGGPELAFYFGWSYSAERKTTYGGLIHRYYPDGILLHRGDNTFTDFGRLWSPELIIRNYPGVYIYYLERDTAYLNQQLKRFVACGDSTGSLVHFERVIKNRNGFDNVIRMVCDTARARKVYGERNLMFCSFEEHNGDSIFPSSNAAIPVRFSPTLNQEQSLTGKYSLKLTGENAFGGEIFIPVKGGNTYIISVWRKSDSDAGWIDASAGDNGEYFQSNASSHGEYKNGWEKVSIQLPLPADFPFTTVRIILHNNDLNGTPMWFDDLSVAEIETAAK